MIDAHTNIARLRKVIKMNDLEVFDYECNGQFSMLDYMIPQFKIENKIRLIELFAGY